RGAAPQPPETRKARLAVVLGDRVLPDREIADNADFSAVLWHTCDVSRDECTRSRDNGPTVDANLPTRRRQQSAQGVGELCLAVTRDAGDAEDLTSPNVEGGVPKRVADGQVADRQEGTGSVVRDRGLTYRCIDAAPHHEFGDLRLAERTCVAHS